MEYIYYKAAHGNFGDDLNDWLWPKFFGVSKHGGDCLLGIGSILYNGSELLSEIQERKKIVFGSGVRPYYEPLITDDSWDIRFLRGPRSVKSIGKNNTFITDAAYAIRLTKEFGQIQNTEKKYKISVMPYFHSVKYLNWKKICYRLGYNYISPLSENGVEYTMQQIAASQYIITEAMHGAIVADAFRVPWSRFILTTPYTEGQMISEFKWMDWLDSIQTSVDDPVHIKLYRNSFINKWVNVLTRKAVDVKFFLKNKVQQDVITALQRKQKFHLSKDGIINNIDSKIHEQIDALLQQQ